jgi:hemoglobin/transferrin/lactoferrin receptor protein
MKIIYAICFSFLGFSVMAQSPLPDSTTLTYDSTVVLGELVISANKIPEMRSKVAQQIFVVSAAEIRNLNTQTTADLVMNSGMVGMQKSQQGGGSPQMRGFEANRIVLVVDGVRLNNLIYRGGHLQNILTLDNNIMERAEILLGPSSTVYGSDALGGVIHLRTADVQLSKDDQTKFTGNAFLRFGTVNNEKTSHIDINVGGKKIGSLTSFTFSDFDDLKMGKRTNPSYGEPFGLRFQYVKRSADNTEDRLVQNDNKYLQRYSGYRQWDFLQKFFYRQSDRVDHTLNFQYSNSSNIPRYDRLTDPDGTGLRNAEWYYGPQERLLASYRLGITKPGVLADAANSVISYQKVQESRHDRRFNRVNRRNQIEDVNVFAITIDFTKRIDQHSLRYGFDSQWSNLTSTAFNENVLTGERSPVATRYPDGTNTMNYYALYLTHTYDIGRNISLTDGLRAGGSMLNSSFRRRELLPFPFQNVKQQNKYLSGSAGLIYRPSAWKISFLASTGFRVPNVDDLSKIFETNAESVKVPNENVKPEKTVNFDLGVTRQFGEKLIWENTGFYTLFYDAIVLDNFTLNGESTVIYNGEPTRIMANQNKRRAYISGFSSILRFPISSRLALNGSLNFTRGRIKTDTTDAPLDHIPPAFGRISARYSAKKLSSEVFCNFNGWKRIDDYLLNSEDNEAYATPEGMPSWYTINLRLSYQLAKNFRIQAGVDNVMDLQYRTFSSGINAPGRNFFATLRIGF